MLIVIEGINQSGKSTAANHLCDHFEAESHAVSKYHFPTDDADERITEMLQGDRPMDPPLFVALTMIDRLAVRRQLSDELSDGSIVVCDRYTPSGVAYGRALGLDIDWLHALATPMPIPDHVFLLDVPIERSIARLQGEEESDYFERDPELLHRVREAYLRMAKRSSEKHDWKVLDGTNHIEIVTDEMRSFIDEPHSSDSA